MSRDQSSAQTIPSPLLRLPSGTAYLQSLEDLPTNFSDPEIQQAVVARTGGNRRIPMTISGNFAMIAKLHSEYRDLGIRMPLRRFQNMRFRYEAIAKAVRNLPHRFAEVQYQNEGVTIDGRKYPIWKMSWIDGLTLGDFLVQSLGNDQALSLLLADLRLLMLEMERHNLAHGDLSVDNIMIANNNLILVDYDNMYTPELDTLSPIAIGDPHLQHPQMVAEPFFGPMIDRFTAIALYLSLSAIRHNPRFYFDYGPFIFRKPDYLDPSRSRVFDQLQKIEPLAEYVRGFMQLCERSVHTVPTLETFLHNPHSVYQSRKIDVNALNITNRPNQIFVSHSTRDDPFVQRLVWALRQAGFQLWVDHDNIMAGDDWDASVEAALEASDAMILVLSKRSVTSHNVKVEWDFFLRHEKMIYPVMLEPCRVPFRLELYQRTDFIGPFETGIKHLLRALNTFQQ
jgi:hypothetical protein